MGRGYAAAKARRQVAAAAATGQGALSANEVSRGVKSSLEGYDPIGKDKENVELLMKDKPFETMTDAKFMEVTNTGLKRAAYASKYGGKLNSGNESIDQQWNKRAEQLDGILQRLELFRSDVLSRGNVSVSDRKAYVKALRTTADAAVRLKVMSQGSNRFTNTELRRLFRGSTASTREAQALDKVFSRTLRTNGLIP